MLFLDSDVLPTGSDFIHNYLKEITNNSSVVFCGGIKYIETDENKKLLRYKYGINYEEIKLGKRKKQAYKFFFTSNFLISKEIFKRIQFEEKLKKYGREDLLFSLHLKAENHKIIHIKKLLVGGVTNYSRSIWTNENFQNYRVRDYTLSNQYFSKMFQKFSKRYIEYFAIPSSQPNLIVVCNRWKVRGFTKESSINLLDKIKGLKLPDLEVYGQVLYFERLGSGLVFCNQNWGQDEPATV